jgi:RNA polymerase sigma-70 factor (ECF subfamily)
LHYWEAMSGSEIAACFGEPEGTVRSRLRRAKVDLREALEHVADNPDLLSSTLADLDRWIASLREQVPRPRARK